METQTILIKNAKILGGNHNKGSVLIENDKIVEISHEIDVNADKVINAENKILMPGLVNTHTHLSMTLLRGLADDLPLDVWLNEHIWPMESHLNGEYCYAGALLACIEMIKSGTTTFNDMYFFMDDVARAVEETGLRGVLSHGMIDLGDGEKRKAEFEETERVIKKCHGAADGRISVAFGPHSPYTCSKELLEGVREKSDKYGALIHIHVSETENEIQQVKEAHGKRPFEYLNDIGFLGENVLAAHAVHLSPEEVEIIKNKGVKLSHNPASNMKLASGVSPVDEMIKKGVCVSLGTDGAASNNNLDILEEMKLAALLQKVNNMDPEALSAETVFQMATANGADALGMKNDLGTIEVGKKADLILLDMKTSHLTPFRHPKSHIVYSANGCDVNTTICNGQILMENKKVISFPEIQAIEIAENAAVEMLSKD
ncbi:amidohydrolase family protein [Methanobacterium alcaliphilum]|uniref:amidohydrolase family protein n=1 Tax=Methanobacterium alcaliphilum TaxID=392018 RepID=UPI00200A41FC|nr:amidohydrolase family protein [Methanobacterium alcaliphilum]MCK9152340.1 amidohydrolase family protein [Methanobacterium alcaliphilum]